MDLFGYESRVNHIRPEEVEITAVRAQGAGGQNINKLSSAVHLRVDIRASSLTDTIKQRLLAHPDRRITSEGVVIIKPQHFRSRERAVALGQSRPWRKAVRLASLLARRRTGARKQRHRHLCPRRSR